MNVHELSTILNGMGLQYPFRLPPDLTAQAKAAGLVIAYGASDDLLEFEGAIHDELDAYEGCTVLLTTAGLLLNRCENSDCPYHAEERGAGVSLQLLWDKDGYSWTFQTTIPHETFEVMEGEEKFCRGIVFALADAKK